METVLEATPQSVDPWPNAVPISVLLRDHDCHPSIPRDSGSGLEGCGEGVAADVDREAREKKATKSDNAPVPKYLWTEHFMDEY